MLNEVTEHFFGSIVRRNYTVANGLDDPHKSWLSPQHQLRFLAYSDDVSIFVEGNDGRLIQHDTLPRNKDAGVGRTGIKGQFAAQQ